ncbi:PREDICTED: polyadenylation and cleavage factor homolog 4-like isoform X2 [Nelumbo nucifera]|uniref:CID domain-containing protein n=2 Tax=Nelumbo nucifera TaxID=4432 RepID=A0A822XW44_NELNU|nr:PREDICTED: polyadenylation and cleavage factor homolog 4-like isoform X2 [Nelumbo nucifera]DAD23319.1 TPA_asm: hypothetical protein HUJ06_024782 [Nelumbo nucifera]
MEEERFFSSRENPRNLGFLSERGASNSGSSSNNNCKAVPNDLVQKPPPPILERFRSLLKEREEEMRVSEDNDVRAPSTEETVRLYEVVLSELTFNSKPIITELTIIAGEQREHGEGIAGAICAHIIEVPVEQKLPSLYLLDSIVKNIGREYVMYFSSRLPEVFCEAYRQVHPNLCPAMRHLFGTWSAIFPAKVLRTIEIELQFSPRAKNQSSGLKAVRSSEDSPSPRSSHGIHVNPKYLEEVQRGRGISSSLQIYGQKPTIEYGEHDSDHGEVISPRVVVQRLDSQGASTHSSVGSAERLLPTKIRLTRPSSPTIGPARSLSPSNDGFSVDNSPRKVVDRVSPSHSGSIYGPRRMTDNDGERSYQWLKHWPSKKDQKVETSSMYNIFSNIDACGNFLGKNVLNEKHSIIKQLDVNGIKSKEAATRWQNTEEEEYIWEDMSPTLADRNRGNDIRPQNSPFSSISRRNGLGRPSAAILEPDFKKGNWPDQVHFSVPDDSAAFAGDVVSILGSGHFSMGKKPLSGPGIRNESTQVQCSHYPHEPRNFLHRFPQPLQEHLDPKARGTAVQMTFPASRIVAPASQNVPSQIDKFPDADVQPPRFSRIGSSGATSLNVEVPSAVMPASTLLKHVEQRPSLAPPIWPLVNVSKSHQPCLLPVIPQQNQIKSQFDIMDVNNPVKGQIPKKPLTLPVQHLDGIERNVLQFANQQAGLISLNQQYQGHASLLQQQLLLSQNAQENLVPPATSRISSHMMEQFLSNGHMRQGHGPVVSSILSNSIPGIPPSSVTSHGISNTRFHLQGQALPPLPPGPPPASLQMGPITQNVGPIASHPSTGSAFSGLIGSLVAQGLISLTALAPVQDSVGVEFNPDLLKVRHESAIKALYDDLPRQCTTCGLRFKCQEEHSTHMDWHVTKNRISKNRKQKPSRKWFITTSVWLSGAEALGTDAVPGFLPTEAIVEKDDSATAVPADENQSTCALCGERFDDFYSDETEEWMYKGAVYLNAPDDPTADMDRSQLGPIVHAKCRSESTLVPSEDFGLDGNAGEGSERKRMRS